MTYNLIKNTFQRGNASIYQLSILAGMDSLVYSVHDTEANELLVLKTVDVSGTGETNDWAKALRQENLLDLLYRRVKIAMVYPHSAFIPARLFNEEEKSTYLTELADASYGDKVQDDDAEALGLKVVYPPKSAEGVLLAQRFPNAKFYNGVTAFLTGCTKMVGKESEHTVFVHIFEDCFYCSILEKERLLFCNTFKYQTASDVMYFLLLAMEQYGVDAEKAQLRLSGKIVENSDIYKMLYRYVLNIDFLPQPDFLKMDSTFSNVPSHFFFPLYGISLL